LNIYTQNGIFIGEFGQNCSILGRKKGSELWFSKRCLFFAENGKKSTKVYLHRTLEKGKKTYLKFAQSVSRGNAAERWIDLSQSGGGLESIL
jgi:hypothetical protein